MTSAPAPSEQSFFLTMRVAVLAALACAPLGLASNAYAAPRDVLALSEIKRDEVPPEAEETEDPAAMPEQPAPVDTVPMPDPIERLPLPQATEPAPASGTDSEEAGEPDDAPDTIASEPLPEIIHDLDRLPEPVRRMRALIMEACASGDLEALRPLIGPGPNGTQLSFGGPVDDPIAYLQDVSGDGGGQEILAILLEVLDAGFVHLEPGTPNEIYVWPYFFAMPLEGLTPPQRVELFKIVTAGDYEDMKNFGGYNFYRVGINPDGRWLFFVAGD